MTKTKEKVQAAMLVVLQNLKRMAVEEGDEAELEKIRSMACELEAYIKVYVK